MSTAASRGEIRDSEIRALLDKVTRHNYDRYLLSLRLERLRLFSGASISFDFPVTALVGPNGGGKTTVLGACGCIFSAEVQKKVFQISRFGDDGPTPWHVEYECIDRRLSRAGPIRGVITFEKNANWKNTQDIRRTISFLSLMRTLPLAENPTFQIRSRLTKHTSTRYKSVEITSEEISDDVSSRIRQEGERVLGKSLVDYRFYKITATSIKLKRMTTTEKVILPDGRAAFLKIHGKSKPRKPHSIIQTMAIGKNSFGSFSELNFGSGESSVLRIIADIELMADNSLILIDELENGLHPIAARRLVEYLIDVATRKKIQAIFTTHSDYALEPLPSEAIWACMDGTVQQGKLSVPSLRAISGRVEKRLAIFVEDEFVRQWLLTIIRERLPEAFDEIGIYPMGGDSLATKTHMAHLSNPAVLFKSLCFIDGDSMETESKSNGIFRMPGEQPEMTVFNDVVRNLDNNIALLAVACQRPLAKQDEVRRAVTSVSHTNRDPHLLFAQVGEKLGFLPEATVRGAFIAIWIEENPGHVDRIGDAIKTALKF